MRRLCLVVAVVGLMVSMAAAQNPDLTPFQLTAKNSHTNCTITAGETHYCFAGDGLWESKNGAAYVELIPGSGAGVLSFNGRTGAVVSTLGDYTFGMITGVVTVGQLPLLSALNGQITAAQLPVSVTCKHTITIPPSAVTNSGSSVVLTAVASVETGCV
jgi:hypothetical protein